MGNSYNLLLADSSGIKTKSSFKQQALRVIVAEAILNVILMALKTLLTGRGRMASLNRSPPAIQQLASCVPRFCMRN